MPVHAKRFADFFEEKKKKKKKKLLKTKNKTDVEK